MRRAASAIAVILLVALLFSGCASSGDEATSSSSTSESVSTVPGEKIPDEGRYAPGPMGSSGSVHW